MRDFAFELKRYAYLGGKASFYSKENFFIVI